MASHTAESIAKKLNIRKALKNVIFAILEEAQGYLNEDADNDTKKNTNLNLK